VGLICMGEWWPLLLPPSGLPGRLDGTALESIGGDLTTGRGAPTLLPFDTTDFSAALMISSSSRFKAAQSTIHSTMSSFPSPNVCHTAFSSDDFPVMLTRVPPPPPPLPTAEFF
jgi:hypothetical protein